MATVHQEACNTCRENLYKAIGKVRDCASTKVGRWIFGILITIAMLTIAASFGYTTLCNASRAAEAHNISTEVHKQEVEAMGVSSDMRHMQQQIDTNHAAVMEQLRELKKDIKALKR